MIHNTRHSRRHERKTKCSGAIIFIMSHLPENLKLREVEVDNVHP